MLITDCVSVVVVGQRGATALSLAGYSFNRDDKRNSYTGYVYREEIVTLLSSRFVDAVRQLAAVRVKYGYCSRCQKSHCQKSH